jgi:hypothetical protein
MENKNLNSDHVAIAIGGAETKSTRPPSHQHPKWMRFAHQGLRQLSEPAREERRGKRSQQADDYISRVIANRREQEERREQESSQQADAAQDNRSNSAFEFRLAEEKIIHIPFHLMSKILRFVGDCFPFYPTSFESTPQEYNNYADVQRILVRMKEAKGSIKGLNSETSSTHSDFDGARARNNLSGANVKGNSLFFWGKVIGKKVRKANGSSFVVLEPWSPLEIQRIMEDKYFQLQVKCHLIRFWVPVDSSYYSKEEKKSSKEENERKKIRQQVLKKEFKTMVSSSATQKEKIQAQQVVTEQLNDSTKLAKLNFNKELKGREYPVFGDWINRPAWHAKETPVFVRDIVSLSRISQASKRMRELVMDTVWGEHEQASLRTFHEEFREIVTEMNKSAAEVHDMGSDLVLASNISDNFEISSSDKKFQRSPIAQSCFCFMLMLATWLGVVSIQEVTTNFNATRHFNSSTNRTDQAFQGVTMADVDSYNMVIAALAFCSVASCICLVRCVRMCLPLCRWRRTMWHCCCGAGLRKTWSALKLSQSASKYTQKYYAALFWFFFLCMSLGPELGLIRALLWSRMTTEQRNIGTISELLFPLWPFFMLPAVAIPAGLAYLSYGDITFNWKWATDVRFSVYYFVLGSCAASSFVLYVLKLDGVLSEDTSLFVCSIPLFISVVMNCLTILRWATLSIIFPVGCVMMLGLTLVALLIVKYDNVSHISFYVFPSVCLGWVGIFVCWMTFIFLSLSGWGSS